MANIIVGVLMTNTKVPTCALFMKGKAHAMLVIVIVTQIC